MQYLFKTFKNLILLTDDCSKHVEIAFLINSRIIHNINFLINQKFRKNRKRPLCRG